jgi:hypothetical protein
MLLHLLWHILDARSDDVVRNDTLQLVEPKQREFRENAAFFRNALGTRKAMIRSRRIDV